MTAAIAATATIIAMDRRFITSSLLISPPPRSRPCADRNRRCARRSVAASPPGAGRLSDWDWYRPACRRLKATGSGPMLRAGRDREAETSGTSQSDARPVVDGQGEPAGADPWRIERDAHPGTVGQRQVGLDRGARRDRRGGPRSGWCGNQQRGHRQHRDGGGGFQPHRTAQAGPRALFLMGGVACRPAAPGYRGGVGVAAPHGGVGQRAEPEQDADPDHLEQQQPSVGRAGQGVDRADAAPGLVDAGAAPASPHSPRPAARNGSTPSPPPRLAAPRG